MRHDILFHLTKVKDFKEHKNNGYYEPPILEEKGYIPCAGGDQIEDLANRLFPGKKRILMLVIDVSTLQPEVKVEDDGAEEEYPHIYGPLNLDAIIDKIKIQSEEEGGFEISFESFS